MAKKVINFTQSRIRDLPIPDKGRAEYYDSKKTSLMCRVSSSGHKSFNVVKWKDGKTHRVTIGNAESITVDYAQKEHDSILDQLNKGIKPKEQKRKSIVEKTKLAEVLEQYLSERDLKPYTVKNYRYKLELGFKDWLNKPINSITEDMILKRHKLITKTGKTTANTTMRVLRLTLNYAVAVGMIENNPSNILSKARLWHKNKRKDRVIPSNQLKEWYQAVGKLSNQKAKVYLLMTLFMGYRNTELLTLEWSNVDFQAQKITLYDTKNRSNHTLPIPNVLIDQIKALNEETGAYRWVFAGKDPNKFMDQPRKQITKVIQASNVEFSPHDCRRTFATIAEAVNLPMSMIKRMMNHTASNDVTGGYIVTEEETLRQAINKVADYILARVTQQDNVITLKSG